MSASAEIRSIIEEFAAELEALVERRAQEAFAAKFDAVRDQITPRASASSTRTPASTPRVVARAAKPHRGPPAGYKVAPKPCPVCGKPNTARRFAFLCEDHRSPENVARFKRKP